MAGLWEQNHQASGDGTTLLSCTVITTAANRTTGQVHDRMPVILDPDQYDRWLDPGFRDQQTLKGMLDSAPESLLELTPVSRHVNNPKNDDAQCVAPLSDSEPS
jgi:putative SOS response-associated peptidase YedK